METLFANNSYNKDSPKTSGKQNVFHTVQAASNAEDFH